MPKRMKTTLEIIFIKFELSPICQCIKLFNHLPKNVKSTNLNRYTIYDISSEKVIIKSYYGVNDYFLDNLLFINFSFDLSYAFPVISIRINKVIIIIPVICFSKSSLVRHILIFL